MGGCDTVVPSLWNANVDVLIIVSVAEGLSKANLLCGKSKHGSKDQAELN